MYILFFSICKNKKVFKLLRIFFINPKKKLTFKTFFFYEYKVLTCLETCLKTWGHALTHVLGHVSTHVSRHGSTRVSIRALRHGLGGLLMHVSKSCLKTWRVR